MFQLSSKFILSEFDTIFPLSKFQLKLAEDEAVPLYEIFIISSSHILFLSIVNSEVGILLNKIGILLLHASGFVDLILILYFTLEVKVSSYPVCNRIDADVIVSIRFIEFSKLPETSDN